MPPSLALLLASALTQAVAIGQPAAVEGRALVEDTGRPAADVVLRFEVPGRVDDEVVADDQGRFRWVPDEHARVAEVRDGDPGPSCWIRQGDPRWRGEVVDAEPGADSGVAPVREGQLGGVPVTPRWRVRDGRASLEVQCPPWGELELAVRGPDAAPLADRELWISPFGAARDDTTTALRLRGRTDADGRARIRWFPGPRPLRVWSPGVGFGMSGSAEVLAGRTVRVEPAPLARFGRVEGAVEPDLAGPETRAVVGEGAWDGRRAPVDGSGRFAIEDVVPGRMTVRLVRGGKSVPTEPAGVTVAPGEAAEVALRGPAVRPAERADIELERGEGVWVEGTVRDEEGRPLEGVRVAARAISYGFTVLMGMPARLATTDAAGRFRIEGTRYGLMGPFAVWAVAEGRPVAMAYAMIPRRPGDPPPPLDLAVASRGAEVRVDVVRDGEPAAGVDVALEPDPTGNSGGPAFADLGEPTDREMAPVRLALVALARTGPDGSVRFRNLTPGLYRAELRGTSHPAEARHAVGGATQVTIPMAAAGGIAAVTGEESRYRIAIHPRPFEYRLKVRRPDGSTPDGGRLVVGADRREEPLSLGTGLEPDDRGGVTEQFDELGLWVVKARFRDSTRRPNTFDRIDDEPFSEARAVLPISPGLPLPDPVELTAWRREPGSVRARLRDDRGEPARGTILLVSPFGRGQPIRFAGTTDARGEVVFRDVPSGRLVAVGFLEGQSPPPDARDPGSIPDADELRGRRFVPEASIEVRAGSEAEVELGPRPAGYILGALRPPTGRDPTDYDISAWDPDARRPVAIRHDPRTGRFLCGPLADRVVAVGARDGRVATDAVSGSSRRVEVRGGEVTEIDLPPPPASAEPGASLPGAGTGSLREAIAAMPPGTVERADGRPAAGARAVLFVPGRSEPTAAGVADGAGRLTWGGLPAREDIGAPGAPRPPDRPTAVVWMPGETGAAFAEVRLGQAVRVVLPRPLAISGRLTLGGRPFQGRDARVRVVAAARGRGALDRVLGAEASVEADGRFTLRGLTPGRYALQAARDEIWLSRTLELEVSPDEPTAAPVLDIAEPGEAVAVAVVDERGRPAVNRAVTPVRPDGPLATLWPDLLRTDASGTVVIRGLEEGAHALRVEGWPEPREIRIPRAGLPGGDPVPIRLTP